MMPLSGCGSPRTGLKPRAPRRCLAALAAVALCLGSTVALPEETVPVLFSGPVEPTPHKLYLDGVFVGLMGDAVNIPLGLRRVSIQGPHGAWLDMNLTLGIGWIGNEGVSVRQTCHDGPEFVESWPWSYQPLADRAIVRIQKPVIGRGEARPCPRKRLPVFRNLGTVHLAVTSAPSRSVILINGGRKGTTPSKIGVPYDEKTDLITVVVRREGHVNCRAELRPPFPEEQEIECRLEPF